MDTDVPLMVGILPFINAIDRQEFNKLRRLLDDRIPYGPFAGTVIVDQFSWGDACLKLLGYYEHYLHPVLLDIAKKKIDGIINIGCAEGYYAIGLGRMFPSALIHAHDISKESQRICKRMAEINGLSARITVGGLIDSENLMQILELYEAPFIMMDIEGGEYELLNLNKIPALARSEILCECHEWLFPTGIEGIVSRFSNTHFIKQIDEIDLPATSISEISGLPGQIRMALVCEKRGRRMKWLHLQPLNS